MNKRLTALGSTLFISMLLFLSCVIKKPQNGNLSLETAIAKYKSEYLSTEVEWIKWKGDISICDEGVIPENVRKKALKRINYFRTLCGLYPVVFKEEYNRLAQKAAAIILINNKLSHYPDKSWKCFTEEAYKGTSNSSLGFSNFGYHDPDAFISGFIKDGGENNEQVGHRRDILYSKASSCGYGATSRTEAIYHTTLPKGEDQSPIPTYIAYPAEGYNEIDLVYPRWSFGLPKKYKVDYSQVKVTLTDDKGNNIPTTILPYKEIFDPTIVWEFSEKIKREELLNKVITVLIKNVQVDGVNKNYTYLVKFFDYHAGATKLPAGAKMQR